MSPVKLFMIISLQVAFVTVLVDNTLSSEIWYKVATLSDISTVKKSSQTLRVSSEMFCASITSKSLASSGLYCYREGECVVADKDTEYQLGEMGGGWTCKKKCEYDFVCV